VDFLSKLTPNHLGPDNTHTVWPASQIALQETLFNETTDARQRVEFLERIVKTQPGDRIARGRVMWWAITELCDAGVVRSLPVIQEAINGLQSSTGPGELQFCQARIQALQRDPDRVKALGSVLRVDTWHSDRLVSWAIHKLHGVQTSEADAELDRFASEIAAFPEGSPVRQRFGFRSQEIRDLQQRRSLRPPRPTEPSRRP
jgi:hypothetical protein